MNNSKPNRRFRCGSIRAAVWSKSIIKDGIMVEVHSIKIEKSYKDRGEWKNTSYFAVEDLPKVALVAEEAYKSLRLKKNTLQNEEIILDPKGAFNNGIGQ